MQNGLWWENPLERRLGPGREVTVFEADGPGCITMIHFALPEVQVLDRKILLQMFWDHEPDPSVSVPLPDFFCDPNGVLPRINSALVTKRQGWNAFFPMPFARHARVRLLYDGDTLEGLALRRAAPCYSYVACTFLDRLPEDLLYFHACWNQEVVALGEREYCAAEIEGPGHVIGAHFTLRGVTPGPLHYPVDENVRFYRDGESTPAIDYQGLEDYVGSSWGFPGGDDHFPYYGWTNFYAGKAAYRFLAGDAISFEHLCRVTVGFGPAESDFVELYSGSARPIEISSVVHWYQAEPHRPLPKLPPPQRRAPHPDIHMVDGAEIGRTVGRTDRDADLRGKAE